MSTLLVSLGTSPAIVPEAFLLPGVSFSAVHVLTTASVKESDLDFIAEWFAAKAPSVSLSFTRVAEFTDFKSEHDHFQFEEVLYRWWLVNRPTGESPHVCLSGGFKTMSAAMQKAAAVLGAAEVFHVLCDLPFQQQPKTAEEIETAQASDHLHWIKLGGESGWPQFRALPADHFPLTETHREDAVRWVSAPDSAFRDHLREIVERSHNIAGSWENLADLPFASLATWTAAQLQWLRQPLDPLADRDWVAALPKIDLHCHLGGFATHGELLAEVRAAAEFPESLPPLVEPALPAGWPFPETPVDLEAYRKLGDAGGSAILKDPGCLRRHIERLYQHFQEQNLVYAEVRCSPANYATSSRSAWHVLADIRAAFEQSREAAISDGRPAPLVNLIVIATRQTGGDFRTGILRHVALAATAFEHWGDDAKPRIVGVDLAGFEDRATRAHYFRDDFMPALRLGMGVTVHAGENDDAEGIWSAILDLNARRLGHALHLSASPSLLRSVADRRIGIEMCPYANLQIIGFPLDAAAGNSTKPYPLQSYLAAGIPATINTDNIGISAASLTDNFLLLPRLCPGITRLDVLRLLRNAIDQAFLSTAARRSLLSGISMRSVRSD